MFGGLNLASKPLKQGGACEAPPRDSSAFRYAVTDRVNNLNWILNTLTLDYFNIVE